MANLRENDWAVLVDWSRLGDPRVFGRVRIPFVNLFLIQANAILVGRISCKFVKFLITKHGVHVEDIFLLGFSSGAGILGFLADYCRHEYKIHLNHMLGMDMFAIPYRRSNYALTNHTSAKFFDAIFTTKSPATPGLDEAAAFLGKEGFYEVVADCAYYVNPELLLAEQPPCIILPGPTFCSHFYSVIIFLSAYSGRCLYRYGPCPEIVGVPSNQETGLTRLNCADHPFLRRTCITSGLKPLDTC
ncbi:phospholipase A1-like [Brevipalpus obovatus]|uniref:phospholipase A1-like n=1 Tax=Brevipalpus obovatus TaxID=246614 RepID=UPI003D9E9928